MGIIAIIITAMILGFAGLVLFLVNEHSSYRNWYSSSVTVYSHDNK
jgi:multisubunit Na+/H+ antiporter MnhC subunit